MAERQAVPHRDFSAGGKTAPPLRARPGDAPLSLTRLYGAMGMLAAVSLFFIAFPGLDLHVAALFHADGGFPATQNPSLVALRALGKNLVVLACAVLIAGLAMQLVRSPRRMPIRASHIWFLLASLALGPGLIVNGILKSLWGRPRPIQVDLFGGAAPFETAWTISGACQSNCSFVSGEAASAFWLLGLVLLAPPRYRPALAAGIGLLAFALSLNRLAFGGHFLSDILISWAITLVVMFGLARLMLEEPFRSRIDAATESALGQLALASRAALGRIARQRTSDHRSGPDRVDPPN
ncbi:phosphatase PAP2 family protein [Kaistia nematophila]|uniref:Phosphatase PAP2 family protein n=1 Tax=Kaistia nematophila TaxID=2994654 RepID=A0A9X3IJ00_9HYPH|nr:phosphatase PAP2 family protein [Kaistia nematophila]MCX5567918.1 phosphatase PAP2 family protein [Kaistia nematophila]